MQGILTSGESKGERKKQKNEIKKTSMRWKEILIRISNYFGIFQEIEK
jgi:hypothetical protein